MERRLVGRTGLDFSRIILGCGNFGGIGSAPAFFGQGESEEEAFAVMDAAWSRGSPGSTPPMPTAGGRSETGIGKWIASDRNRPRLTTKTYNPKGDPEDHGLAPDRILRQIETSLGRLGVDQVDLYLTHEFDPATPIDETLDALERLRDGDDRRLRGVNFEVAWLEALEDRAPVGPERVLAARRGDEDGRHPAVRRARDRLPGLQPAGGRVAHGQYRPGRGASGRDRG